MKRFSSLLMTLCALVGLVSPAYGAMTQPEISLITFYPYQEIYELDGHTALRIRIPHDSIMEHSSTPSMMDMSDIAVSWGTFDFESPNFIYRFVKGETDYWCSAVPFQYYLDSYKRKGTKVVEQKLDLDSLERAALVAFAYENLQPQNRTYRYNYVLDNCATRPLRAIEAGVGSELNFPNQRKYNTFRDLMKLFHQNYPWYQFGIDMVLGTDLDYPITVREANFEPVILMEQIQEATKPNGKRIVTATNVLYEGKEGGAIDGPTPWYLTPMFVFWTMAVIVVLITVFSHKNFIWGKWCDAILFGGIGLAGCLITFLMCISVHYAVTPNIMILGFEPLALLVPIFIWTPTGRHWLKWFFALNLLALLAMAVIQMCHLGVLGTQSINPAVVPILLSSALRSCIRLLGSKF